MEVFLIAAMSANGKIAEYVDQASLDWTSKEDMQFFVKKTKEAGNLVMGRTTFETIGKPLPKRLNVIMTRTPDASKNIDEQLLYTDKSPEEIIEYLSNKGFDQVAIAGGAQIYSLFLKSGLVTDLYLTIEPVLFAGGVPLIEGMDRLDLELVEHEALGEQAIMLHYKVKNEA